MMGVGAVKRRELIAFAGTALLTLPLVARAAGEIARLGFLGLGNPAPVRDRVAALRAGLRDLGMSKARTSLSSSDRRPRSMSCTKRPLSWPV